MILLEIRSKSVVRVKLYFSRNHKEGCYVGVVLYHDIISSISLVLLTVSKPFIEFLVSSICTK